MTTITLVSFISCIALAGGFYWYYNSTQQKMSTLVSNNAKLELAIEESEGAITSLIENYERVNQELSGVYDQFTEIRRQNRELVERFEGSNIGFLAENKPQLVENIVNNASRHAIRCFELMSGAPLNEGERNATTPREFNQECPWMFNSIDGR